MKDGLKSHFFLFQFEQWSSQFQFSKAKLSAEAGEL